MSEQQTLSRPITRGTAQTDAAATNPMASQAIDWEALAPQGWYGRKGHRLLDLALLSVVLPMALLPLAVVAIANWLYFRRADEILFKQARVGHQGLTFTIFKFRTMRAPKADALMSWAAGQDGARVTWLGRLLRSTHLDELPQLWNVVLGEMSFIGPRPEMVDIESWANEHVPGFTERLAIHPGLSGFAQITQGYTGCDVDAYREKLEINQYYLTHMSLRTDLEIVVRTAWWMVRGKGWDWQPDCSATDESSSPAAASSDKLAA